MKRLALLSALLVTVLMPAQAQAAELVTVLVEADDLVPTTSGESFAKLFGPPLVSGLDVMFPRSSNQGSQMGGVILRPAADPTQLTLMTDNLNLTVYQVFGMGYDEVSAVHGKYSMEEDFLALRAAQTVSGQPVRGVFFVRNNWTDVTPLLTEGDFDGGQELMEFGNPDIARTGGVQVLFAAEFTDGTRTLFVADPFGAVTRLFSDGDDPNGTGSGLGLILSDVSLSRNNLAAFTAFYGPGLGIHQTDLSGGLHIIVRWDDVPDRDGFTYSSIRGLTADENDGNSLAAWFRASNGTDTIEGILAWVDGEVVVIAATDTASPFGPLWTGFGQEPSIVGSKVYFTGGYGPPNPATNALFRTDACTGERVQLLGPGDIVEARSVQEVDISSDAADGDTVVAHATFSNPNPNDPNSFDQAILSILTPPEDIDLGPVTARVDDIENNADGTVTATITTELKTCDGDDKVEAFVTTLNPGVLAGAPAVVLHTQMMVDSYGTGDQIMDALGTSIVITSVDSVSADAKEEFVRDFGALIGVTNLATQSARTLSGNTASSPLDAVYSSVTEAADIGTVKPVRIVHAEFLRLTINVQVFDENDMPLGGAVVSSYYACDDEVRGWCGPIDTKVTENDGWTQVHLFDYDPPWLVTATFAGSTDSVIVNP